MSDEELVIVRREDGWASVNLNRPHRRNALTGPMAEQLAAAIETLGSSDDIAAIVLMGEGGAFCSGIDLKELQTKPQPTWVKDMRGMFRRAHLALFNCRRPIIGALEGYGINAGSALAFASDILIAGESSFLQIGEIQQGARIPMNAAWVRLRHGEAVLARLALYGDRIPASELLRMGLVTEVVDDDAVRGRAADLAARIAGFPVGASAGIKGDIQNQRRVDGEEWFASIESPSLLSAEQVRS